MGGKGHHWESSYGSTSPGSSPLPSLSSHESLLLSTCATDETSHLLSSYFPKQSVFLGLYKNSELIETSGQCAWIHDAISCAPKKTDGIMTMSECGEPNGLVPGTVLSLGES